MAKNRKNQAAAIRFGPVLKVVLLCSLICGSALGYVWQKGEIGRLGEQKRQREIKLRQLHADNKRLSDQIAILHSPVMLDRLAKERQPDLVPTTPMQVVRLVESVMPAPPNNSSRQFTQRSANSLTP